VQLGDAAHRLPAAVGELEVDLAPVGSAPVPGHEPRLGQGARHHRDVGPAGGQLLDQLPLDEPRGPRAAQDQDRVVAERAEAVVGGGGVEQGQGAPEQEAQLAAEDQLLDERGVWRGRGQLLMITGVPSGVQGYTQAIIAPGVCTQPWLADAVFSLPGPKALVGSQGASWM